MAGSKILIISNGALCRNPRVLKEADTLGRHGYDVTVLTVRNHDPSERLDAALMRDAPFGRELVEMIPGASPERARIFLRRLTLWLARKSARSLGLSTPHALGPAGALLRRARRRPAALTIVHNEVAHWVGTRLLAEGRLVAADIEDWHSEDLLPAAQAGRPLALLRRVERTVLHRCAYTSTTSQALADALHARYGGQRPHVVTNSFPLQANPRRGPPGEPPAFFWFSQTLGPGRGLEEFLAAWQETTQPSRVVLVGEALAGYDRDLLAQLSDSRRGLVEIRPPVPPTELPALIARHDIGLALEPTTPANKDLTISNKILQYLNAGLAVVATATAGQREVLARAPKAGMIVDTAEPAACSRALDGLLADRSALATCQAAARRLAEKTYCWEREAPRLLALVEAALGGAGKDRGP